MPTSASHPDRVAVLVRIPRAVHATAKLAAKDNNISVNELIVRLLLEHMSIDRDGNDLSDS